MQAREEKSNDVDVYPEGLRPQEEHLAPTMIKGPERLIQREV